MLCPVTLLPSPAFPPSPALLPGGGYASGVVIFDGWPTPPEVRAVSPLLQQRYPTDGDSDLVSVTYLAGALVASLTGRAVGATGTPGETVPDWLRPVAVQAVAMEAENLGTLGTARARAAAARRGNLRSISAGPWSESYFSPAEIARAGVLDSNPLLHQLLWALATDATREYWLGLWGQGFAPAAAVQSFDWFPEGLST